MNTIAITSRSIVQSNFSTYQLADPDLAGVTLYIEINCHVDNDTEAETRTPGVLKG